VSPAAVFGESRVVVGGRLVEPFVAVVELVAGEQAGGLPGLDRSVVDTELVGDFGDGEQPAGTETVVAAGEAVAGAQAMHDRGGELLAVEGSGGLAD